MSTPEISRRDFLKGLVAVAGTGLVSGAVGAGAAYNLAKYGDEAKAAASAAAAQQTLANATASGLTFTPGTYSASARGINSDVTVTMTFDETMITDIKIDASGETPDIGGVAAPQMEQAILAAQGANVDAVSGATVTCDAIKKAAADCISQASGTEYTLGGGDAAPAAGGDDWLGEAPEIAESDITETLDTEVLVVGCGTGGWITAMTAAEEGAKVLVLEKGEKPINIRHDIGAIGSKKQLESIAQDPKYAIDKTEALQEIVRYAAGYCDSDLVKVWIDESAEMVDWLTDILERDGYFVMN